MKENRASGSHSTLERDEKMIQKLAGNPEGRISVGRPTWW
jgi:hypothetical protein